MTDQPTLSDIHAAIQQLDARLIDDNKMLAGHIDSLGNKVLTVRDQIADTLRPVQSERRH